MGAFNSQRHVAVWFRSMRASILLGLGLDSWACLPASNLVPHTEGTTTGITTGFARPQYSLQLLLAHQMD